MPVPCTEPAVGGDVLLLGCAQCDRRVIHPEKLVKGYLKYGGEHGKKIDIRPRTAVLPVGDGIPGDADPAGELFLSDAELLPETPDPRADLR